MLRSTSCCPNAPSHSMLVGPTTAAAQSGYARLHAQARRDTRRISTARGHPRRARAPPLTAPEPSRAAAVVDDGCAWLTPPGEPRSYRRRAPNRDDCSRAYNPAREADPYRCSGGRVPGRGGRGAAARRGHSISLITNARIIDGTGIPVGDRIGRYTRRAHRGRRPRVGRVGADHRCPRTRRGPWVHRSALAFRLLAADRRKRREQDPAGRRPQRSSARAVQSRRRNRPPSGAGAISRATSRQSSAARRRSTCFRMSAWARSASS